MRAPGSAAAALALVSLLEGVPLAQDRPPAAPRELKIMEEAQDGMMRIPAGEFVMGCSPGDRYG